MVEEEKYIEMKILKESITINNFPDSYEQENLERCVDCGSSIFRVYREPVKEGVYEQIICAVCNHITGGWLNDYLTKEKDNIDGRVCRRCGSELER